jgi:hypothetical protein
MKSKQYKRNEVSLETEPQAFPDGESKQPDGESKQPRGKPNKNKANQLIIQALTIGHADINIIGKQPLIMNRMSEKARQQLLLPPGPKNSAEKRNTRTLKHDPIEEFHSSIYKSSDPSALTAIHMPSGAFASAIAHAALDTPGATKAQIQRLVRVDKLTVTIYGAPKIYMVPVKPLGLNKAPDIRTRAIFPEWAATFNLVYVSDLISANALGTLISAAGFLIGVGDHRPEKAGPYGQFGLADSSRDPILLKIMKEGDRKAQIEAMKNPMPYNDETVKLLTWFDDNMERR